MQELDPQKSYLTTDPLTREKELDAFIALRAGDTSQIDRITRANIRFVIDIAKPFVRPDVSIRELVASGCVGLLKGIMRFDHTRGFKLISFAVHWIRQSILSDFPQLKMRSPVRYPTNVHQLHERIQGTRPRLSQTLQREPALEEIFDEIGKTHPKLVTAGMRARATDTRYEPLSLDDPVHSDGLNETTYHETMGEEDDTQGLLEAEEIRLSVGHLVDQLPPREQRIIRAYFGFDEPARTLEEIGSEIGVTRERVRQIKERAMVDLRRWVSRSPLAEMAV